jgi:hypothetical protein
MNVGDELTKLNELREEGVLSEEEFEAQKKRVLSLSVTDAPAAVPTTETRKKSNLPLILSLSIGIPVLVLAIVLPLVLTDTSIGHPVEEDREFQRENIESARMQVKKVSAAAAQYHRSTGEVPSSVDALVDRKYIKKNDKKDPWKTELSLESSNSMDQPVRVCSFGADMKSGGDDDICDPEQK